MKGFRRSGFTLVEIMIVVAIIGILIAIAVPGFIKARNTSRLNACQENQTKIDGACQQYILENKRQNLADAPELHGGNWSATLVGSDNFLRSIPTCPANGDYVVLTSEGTDGEAVECLVNKGAPLYHIYPKN